MATKKKAAKKSAPAAAPSKPAQKKQPQRITIPEDMTPEEAREILRTDKDLRTYVKEGLENKVDVPAGMDAQSVKQLLEVLSGTSPGHKIELSFSQTPEHTLTMAINPNKVKTAEEKATEPGHLTALMMRVEGNASRTHLLVQNIAAFVDSMDGGGTQRGLVSRDNEEAVNMKSESANLLHRLSVVTSVQSTTHELLESLERRFLEMFK